MKRRGLLWDELVGFPNLLRAALQARRGKRSRPNVEAFHFDLEPEFLRLRGELLTSNYAPRLEGPAGPYCRGSWPRAARQPPPPPLRSDGGVRPPRRRQNPARHFTTPPPRSEPLRRIDRLEWQLPHREAEASLKEPPPDPKK
jgi:hypothetical protein